MTLIGDPIALTASIVKRFEKSITMILTESRR
jgi:hypothetical protein